jgi:hypothetical protein
VRFRFRDRLARYVCSWTCKKNPHLRSTRFSCLTGYMVAEGFPAIILILLVGSLFRVLDSMVRSRVPLWVALSLVIVPVSMLFASADLPTTLLIHGLGVGLIMLELVGRPRSGSKSADISAVWTN